MSTRKLVVTSKSFARRPDLVDQLNLISGLHVTVNPVESESSPEELILKLQGFELAIVGREPVSHEVLTACTELRAIAKYGVGLDNIDFDAANEHKVAILHTPGVNADSAAEHTVGLVLALTRNIATSYHALCRGQWVKNGGVQVYGRTVAVVGAGSIGSRVARILKSLGCKIVLVDIEDRAKLAGELSATQLPFDDALKIAQVVTFHVPLTNLTRGMFGAEQIANLPSGGFVVNTSRGQVINLPDLVKALESQHLAGAALDVFPNEPILDKEFWNVPGLIGTPHIAGNSFEAVTTMGEAAINNIRAWIEQHP